MKIFFYKSLLVFFLFLLAFHYSYSYVVKSIERKIELNFSKANIEILKIKIKNEMNNAISKDDFISNEDAELINKFLDKVIYDLNKNNK